MRNGGAARCESLATRVRHRPCSGTSAVPMQRAPADATQATRPLDEDERAADSGDLRAPPGASGREDLVRRGIELDATWRPVNDVRLRTSANLSRNRIRRGGLSDRARIVSQDLLTADFANLEDEDQLVGEHGGPTSHPRLPFLRTAGAPPDPGERAAPCAAS